MSNRADSQSKTLDLQIDDLLHPAAAFDHPADVVEDADLTLNEKRAILAAWASDACALEAVPALRCSSEGKPPVPIDDIFDALRDLDKLAAAGPLPPTVFRQRPTERFKRRAQGGGRLSA
jgi:hypothetical protein